MRNNTISRRVAGMLLLALACAVPAGGCNLLVTGLYVLRGGDKLPAPYPGLAGKRVAVVCVSSTTSYNPSSEAALLAKGVELMLQKNVKNVDIVSQEQVADWIDIHGWNESDFLVIGEGVKADEVVAIELSSFSLHEGKTLYKGRAEITTKVIDVAAKGRMAFGPRTMQYGFPQHSGYHTTEISENGFRQRFVSYLAREVSKYFFAHEFTEMDDLDRPIFE